MQIIAVISPTTMLEYGLMGGRFSFCVFTLLLVTLMRLWLYCAGMRCIFGYGGPWLRLPLAMADRNLTKFGLVPFWPTI